MLGKMNWQNLLAYKVQPSDLELFQTYIADRFNLLLTGSRSKGLIYGGQITVVSALQIRVSAGLAVMPDGQILQFDQTDVTLGTAHASNPRYDRIELAYTQVNGAQVLDENNQTKTLDLKYTPSMVVVPGTAGVTPAVPAQTAGNISLGYVLVPAAALTLIQGNVFQTVGNGFETSSLLLGNKNSYIRYNQTTGQLQFSVDGVGYQPLGSGGGGGAGANWQPVDALAPIEAIEYNEKSLLFSQGALQAASLWVKVPAAYLAGTQIKMKLAHYSPGATNNWKFRAVTTLVRKGVDPITLTTNQNTSTNVDVVNTVANLYLEVLYDLTDLNGRINAVNVGPGDLINIQLQRITPTGTEDVNDVRMIPSSTEVIFS
jgi:hypothetical protein